MMSVLMECDQWTTVQLGKTKSDEGEKEGPHELELGKEGFLQIYIFEWVMNNSSMFST
jgi:hypothetical protein